MQYDRYAIYVKLNKQRNISGNPRHKECSNLQRKDGRNIYIYIYIYNYNNNVLSRLSPQWFCRCGDLQLYYAHLTEARWTIYIIMKT